MEMPTIEMPKAEARKAFLEYRHAVKERHNAEDEMIMRGYRALSQGHQVINLLDVMKGGGEHANGMPKLAVARADFRRVGMRRSESGAIAMFPEGDALCRSKSKRTDFPKGTLPAREFYETWRGQQSRTSFIAGLSAVPNIPPGLRPAAALSNYHILWEADWTRIPADPALLKHCGGWLYVVLAVWDLTPLEQAVLGLTRN